MSVVASFTVSHAPGMLAWPERAEDGVRSRVLEEGYARAGERLRSADPDAVVLVTGEHFANFFSVIPPFCLHIGDQTEGPIEPWLGVAKRTLPTHAELSRKLLEAFVEGGDGVAYSHELVLDHGSMVPIELMGIPADIPLVPLIVNTLVEPMPTLDSCRRLGESLGAALDRTDLRVALLGAGGLSHWPGMAEAGRMSPDWDMAVLDGMANGDRRVLWEPPAVGWEDAGPGAEEIRAWAVVGAATPPGRAETLAYEPVDAWATGCAVVDLAPSAVVALA